MEARGKQSCIFKMLKENKKTALKKKKSECLVPSETSKKFPKK